jgi:hypothetical protein
MEKVENPPAVSEHDPITTVNLYFVDSLTNDSLQFSFRDTDGEGGIPALIDSILLSVHSKYFCSIEILDESNPDQIADISTEILEEGKDHHLCILNMEPVGIQLSFSEAENNHFPIPLRSVWLTSSEAIGIVTIVLKHQEDHDHLNCESGDTEIRVDFPIRLY